MARSKINVRCPACAAAAALPVLYGMPPAPDRDEHLPCGVWLVVYDGWEFAVGGCEPDEAATARCRVCGHGWAHRWPRSTWS